MSLSIQRAESEKLKACPPDTLRPDAFLSQEIILGEL